MPGNNLDVEDTQVLPVMLRNLDIWKRAVRSCWRVCDPRVLMGSTPFLCLFAGKIRVKVQSEALPLPELALGMENRPKLMVIMR